jgi:type I restriction enzyme S subunit
MAVSNDIPDGYKATELGVLPEEWNIENLGDHLSTIRNGITKQQNKEGIGLPVTRIETIREDQIDINRVGYVDELSNEEIQKYRLISGDILFSHINSEPHIGRSVIYDGEPSLLLHGMNLLVLHTQNELNNYFLNFLFRFYREKGIFIGISSRAVNQNSINQGKLKSLKIPLPPLPEQHAIATTLRTVQEAKEKTDAVIAATKALKAAMMKYLFTYGPVPPEDAEMVALKETEIGKVPEEWDLQPLGNLSKISSGGTPSRTEPSYWNGDIPWIRTGEINYSIIDKTEEKITRAGLENSSARIVPKGTLLMAMYGEGITRGRVGITGIDASINQAVAAILPSEKMLTPFLYFYLEFSYEKNRLLGHGAHQRNLSATIIKTILVPIPTQNTQQKIVEILSSIDQKLAAEQSRKEALDTLFTSLLHDLMTTKIRVPGNSSEPEKTC